MSKQKETRWVFSAGRYLVDIYLGTGDNLLAEDRDNGYVGYFNYDIYWKIPIKEVAEDAPIEDSIVDGGMYLLRDDGAEYNAEVIKKIFREYLYGEIGDHGWNLLYLERESGEKEYMFEKDMGGKL